MTLRASRRKPKAPKAIITITEAPGTAGFTIGLVLHGARMEELHPGEEQPVSIVDVIALAIAHTIRTQPRDFQDSVALVNETLCNIHNRLNAGEALDDAMAGADATLDAQ
jgi:hypothetical protein